MFDHARSAQKHSKNHPGTSISFYSEDVNERVVEQMQMEVDLLSALENDEFEMLYQPKLDVRSGDIINAESLIRWHHPTRGLIPPFKFIPLAEKSGIILELGKWILEDVCKQMRRWVDMGINDLRVSVNVSAMEFIQDDFVSNVQACLKRHHLNARHLELEITESAVIHDIDKVSDKLKELNFMGIKMTLDDFGTGYSSFSYLGNLNFDCVKLDRSFLLNAMESERSMLLYESVIDMAHKTGHEVVAEGIETKEQFDFVRDNHIDEIQGYIVSKPIPAEDITSFVKGSVQDLDKAANN